MVTTAAALSVAFTLGCSDAKKSAPVKVTNPDGTDNPVDPGKVVSALDSLVKANKGKGVITGFLSGEGKSIAKGLLKQASNAAGERRLMTRSEIPLTGANVLIFNADKPTTAAAATATTDSSGNYTAILDEGKYFGFAVYLDLETFQLVTTQIPNMNAVKDSAVKMDTAVAIEDVTAPTVLGVYDAASATEGVFLVGSVPAANSKINITFSEPMNRESAKGILLGKVDTSSSTISLADTVKDVEMTWSGDNKEVTLNIATLSAGVQYGIIIPTTLKDLAKNPLESQFKATFAPVDPRELEAVKFAVAATFPENEGGLKPIQNPGLSFNRPVEVFSVVKDARIEPAVTGFWEVIGSRAVFIHKDPLEVGKTYKVTLPSTVKDLTGAELGTEYSFSFTVKDFEGAAATGSGAEKDIALAVEGMFNAYMAGDIGRFSASFHQNFRMFEGSKIESKTQFIEGMKADIGERVNMRVGVLAPVFDTDTALCNNGAPRWKVMAKGGTAEDYLWVEAFVNVGNVPRVYGKDKAEIDRTRLEWDRTGPRFNYNGKTYGFAPDFSQFGGGVNMDGSRDNMRFMGEMMAKTSTIALEPVKLEMKEEFKVDGGMAVKGDTARLAVKMSGTETWSRTNFDPGRTCGHGGESHEFFQIMKFLLVNDGSRWLVLNIIAPEEQIKNREDFEKTVDVNNNFGPVNIPPVSLVSPVNGMNDAADAEGKVAFKFNGVKHDSVGGYLVGLAEDRMFIGGRPPFGLLLFVKASKKDGTEESFTLGADARVTSGNAFAVLRRVHDLGLPGWERTLFEYTLSRLHDPDSGFAGVYQWKVIAVKDTSASQFLGNGFKPERFLGESDFGPTRGHFAVKSFPAAGQFDRFQDQVFHQPVPGAGPGGPVGFGDMDMDGVPDHMETNYGTDPRDRNSYPDFRVDTDGDKMADFLEKKLDPEGKDSLVTKAADAAGIRLQIEALAKLNPPIRILDSDNDGFPDDVEQMYGFNPFDANNNPGTRVRATAPQGVFAGKVQMGANTHTISFKLYQDSTKNLMAAFTAYMGMDTIVDTSRAGFNEIMGEVLMALPLPLDGPDAGRALLFRGNYQAIQSLVMGPVDMIQAPAKGSLNFGSGPYVGQFAASGRGEDVTMYLPGANGGPIGPGPVVGPGPVGPAPTMGYRPPPMGTSEGAQIVLAGAKITVIDDFGDTLAVFPNANWRQQPDGSYDVFAEIRDLVGDVRKRSEMGGRVMMTNNEWIIDGHFMQEIDSAGRLRHFPGQLCAKVASSGMARATVGLEGTLKGWVALDKTGSGFGGPIVGPAPGDTTCRPGMPCGPTDPGIPPVNSFSRPYMGSAARVVDYEKNVLGAEEGMMAAVSYGGRIYQVDLDDPAQLMDTKAPMCGHVSLKPSLVPLKEGAPEEAKRARMDDSVMLSRIPRDHILMLIEDQFMPGRPALLEKARDANGDIVFQVYVVEPRPVPFDYGTSTVQCPANPGPIDPGPVGPGPMGPPLYHGPIDAVKIALEASGNVGLWMKDSATVGGDVTLDPNGLAFDEMKRATSAPEMGNTARRFAFLSGDGGLTLMIQDGKPVIFEIKMDGGTTCPVGTTCPPPDTVATCPAGTTCPPPTGNPPPTGGEMPAFYKGTVENLVMVLNNKGNKVKVMAPPPAQPMETMVNPATLKTDGTMTVVADAASTARLYVVLGDKMDPSKPMLTMDGFVGVMPAPTTAGP